MARIRLALREPIKVQSYIPATSETYTAGEEKTKFTVSGYGVVRTVVGGDGDANVIVRFYRDGVLVSADNTPSNEGSEVNTEFTTSFEIRTYSATAGTFTHATLTTYGWRK